MATDVDAVAVAQDHLGDEVVAHPDEIRARRIERIGEDPGFAGQRPALAREHPRTAVWIVVQPEEVLDQVVVIAADLGGLRLVLVEPGVRPQTIDGG